MFLSAHKKYHSYEVFETQRFSSCQRINEGSSARCLLTSEENISMITDLFRLFRKIAKSDY
jgi:hypothetical protein